MSQNPKKQTNRNQGLARIAVCLANHTSLFDPVLQYTTIFYAIAAMRIGADTFS